jgi:HSP20 family protein
MMAQLPSKNEDPQRKYHGTVKIPPETHIETAIYNNGILEITFNKKKQTKPKGTTINVDNCLCELTVGCNRLLTA